MGVMVVLLEGYEMGGDCFNFGCVLFKVFLFVGVFGVEFDVGKDYVWLVIDVIVFYDS